MIETINYKGYVYPALQAEGNGMQYAMPFAKKILKHCQTTYDVGCNREEWKYPGAIAIDPVIDKRYDAMNFPVTDNKPDSIISSHCLEHLNDWVGVLNYWHSQLCDNGIVFLYLPHFDQRYWRPYANRKHLHAFTPEIIRAYFVESGLWKNVFVTDGYDLNHSFYAVAQKVEKVNVIKNEFTKVNENDLYEAHKRLNGLIKETSMALSAEEINKALIKMGRVGFSL